MDSMTPLPAPEATPGASSFSSSATTPTAAPATAAVVENLAGGVAAMTLEERFETLRGMGEECIQEEELMTLLQNKPVPICYDGFEPSGRMHIAQDQVNVKIKQAFCPPKIVNGNPCLAYIVFPWFGKFDVIRKERNGGNKTFFIMDELISDYESGALHPADVKPALAKAINEILQPVRDHFNNNSEAKVLLNTVKDPPQILEGGLQE